MRKTSAGSVLFGLFVLIVYGTHGGILAQKISSLK